MNRIPLSLSTLLSLGMALTYPFSLRNVHALDGVGTVNASRESGWATYEIVTSGDDISAVDAPDYGSTMTRSDFDGLGAIVIGGNTLRVYVNHESTPASISRVDLDLANFQQSIQSKLDGGSTAFPPNIVTEIGLAYDSIIGDSGFSRFCSGGVHLPDAFGPGKGFTDALYMAGEEVDGGSAYALESGTQDLWEITAFGAHRWENFAPIDTGNTTHTAVALWADSTSGGEFLMIYVGVKNPSGDFLARNGLSGGTIYYFDPVAGKPNGDLPNGTENFVLTTNTADAEYETKLEDIHTNPANGKQLVFSAQNDGLYIMDVDIQFDGSGNVVPGTSTVSVSNALTDDNTVLSFDDPDNLTWSPSGHIYVQEDGSNAGGPANEIWSLLPSDPSGTLTRVGQGHTETSGIIDVSASAGFAPNTVFLFNVMGGSGVSQLVALVNTDAVCPVVSPGTLVGDVSDSRLDEISGLAASSQYPGVLWVHNDSGDSARVFALDANGTVLGTYNLSGASHDDWEDMAVGPGPTPGLQYLYIADTGDNSPGRNSVTIYRVPEPSVSVGQNPVTETLSGVDTLEMTYPGDKYDSETLLVDPLTGDIVIVTRDRSSAAPRVSHVFSYPFPQNPQSTFTLVEHPASELSTVDDIKGGDVSQAGDMVILRASVKDVAVDGLLWNRDPDTPLWEVFTQAFCPVPLAAEEQGEAVSFNAAGTGYYTISEFDGESSVPVYFYSINDNLPPVADDQAPSTNEDVNLNITLTASDGDADPLTYAVVSSPSNGVLTGALPSLTYTPNPNFNGADAFTFIANDGTVNSAAATITITVNPINDAPIALAQSVATNEEVPLVITLSGTDVDGDSLAYTVTTGPANGILSGTAPALTYTPNTNYSGNDSIIFIVNDGTVNSPSATIAITVNPTNDAPVAVAQSVTTDEDQPASITLNGTDVDGDPLTYAVVSNPSSGALTGTPPSLTYTPNPNFNGADSFTFVANDGTVNSAAATITITVNPINDAPVALAQSVATSEEIPLAITLSGTDMDGDSLAYTVTTGPANGSLSGTGANRTYTPNTNYTGSDSIIFIVNDGTVNSPSATIAITVNPTNDAPVAVAQSVTTDEDQPASITLTATDGDGDSLTYAIASTPSNGTLSGTAPALTYTPDADYNGLDAFTFVANDGLNDSAPATVSITVNSINDAPVAVAQSLTTDEEVPLAITLNGTDVDGDPLTYTETNPTNGSLSGTGANRTYTPNTNFAGTDSFTFVANDGTVNSPAATITIDVTADTVAPTAILTTATSSVSVPFDVSVEFSEAVTGLELGDFTISPNATVSNLSGTGRNYTLSVAPIVSGTVSMTLPANSVTDDSSSANGNLVSNTLDVTYEDPNQPSTPHFATSEVTSRGSVSGSLANLTDSDNTYESLTEVSSGGKPSRRFSQLQHTWTFNISGDNPTLVLEAYHDASSDGDHFSFSYSTDGSNFIEDAIIVEKTADNDKTQRAGLGSVSGTVYIRVVDTIHAQGSNTYFDTLHIDQLFIETSSGGSGNTFPTFNSDPVVEANATENQLYSSTLIDDAMDADGDSLTFSKTSGPDWLIVAGDGTLSGMPGTSDVGANTFNVEVADGSGGTASTTLEIQVQSSGGSLDMYVSDITMTSNSHNGNRYSAGASVTVKDQTGAFVSGATIAASWSNATSESVTAVTNGNGVAAFSSKRVKNGGTFMITINGITAAGFNYNDTLNAEPFDSIDSP